MKKIKTISFFNKKSLNDFMEENDIEYIDLKIIEAKIIDWNYSDEYILVYRL